MKLICDCGNEMEFNEIDPETNEKYDLESEYGDGEEQYADKDYNKFDIWAGHEVLMISCQQCGKAIWTFC